MWGGTPERLIEAAGEGTLELVTSEALLAELAGILARPRFAERLGQKNVSATEILERYRELTEIVETDPMEEAALRDPDDAAVLACALAARAEVIVSGDADLHALGNYQGIPILSPATALARITKP